MFLQKKSEEGFLKGSKIYQKWPGINEANNIKFD